MVFNSSSPVPSESLVLSAIQILLSDRLTNLTDSVNLLNFTFEAISDTSYVVAFTFNISNTSMPENPKLRNETYEQVKSIINKALNTLLNDPGAELFQPQSFIFMSSKNQVYGNMDYYFQDGDTKRPKAFLKELAPVSGSSLVQARMVFNFSSPVPSESLVLSAIQILLSDRLTNLTDSVNLLNFTFEAISDTSYAVTFTFNISNTSMPENPRLRNETYEQVKSIINNALNTLLNDPGAKLFLPQSFFFTSLKNQVYGNMDYYFQDGDTKTPAAFLKELAPVSGSSLVQARMVFNSSSPVPSESLVLSAIQILLNDRLINLTDSIKLLNFTYQAISDTSYAVTFTFNISNTSMPENPKLRNETYEQVKSIINKALNTLLNDPGAELFQPQSFIFMSSKNQVYGNMDYYFQDGDTKRPEAFLKELAPVSGSSLVQARMVFNSSSPVPSESLVRSAIQILLSDRLTNLTDSVNLLNFTYQAISDTSYAVTFTFNISNTSMPENPKLRNETYKQVESIINNALNTLLNDPGAELFQPQSFFFMSVKNQIYGNMDYYFQDGDTKTPAAFLKELAPVSGSSLVQAKMVFSSSSPVPSESFVLSAIQILLSDRLTNLTDSVKILNVIYEKISNTSYAVTFTFNISNISMPKNPDLRNKTFNQVEIIINNALNALLNKPGAEQFKPNSFNFMSSENQIIGHMEYYFQDVGTTTPEAFLNEIAPILGNVKIKIRLVFKNLSRIPSKTDVLNAANTLLDAKIRRTRDLTTQKLNEPVSISDVLYENIDNSSYSISFEFLISNVTISKDLQLRNETYDLIQSTINTLLNTILNAKGASPFVFPRANYTFNGTTIIADSEYIFVEGVSQWLPSGFLYEILKISGLATATQTAAPVDAVPPPTVQGNTTTPGGSSAWILGIIIPCAIIIILIPCWILLCCLLCGCCAGLRRRYNRRRSYNVQYTTHNSLF
ncbi:uncharacterized protein LOC128528604 [Clarias gariepinus]|uniref:uncharacterized protein LOC128528604 n=1 Tax=Clarias gariepinus TaxID=13013 RepID=UPI00234CC53E|nr:uncharacterized protein LOC128528604 [Clarias gariepinus]